MSVAACALSAGDPPQGLLIVCLVAISLWGTVRRYWWGFLGLWFFVILAPTSSFLPLATEVGAERRLYLPLIAVVLFVVLTVKRLLNTGNCNRSGLVGHWACLVYSVS